MSRRCPCREVKCLSPLWLCKGLRKKIVNPAGDLMAGASIMEDGGDVTASLCVCVFDVTTSGVYLARESCQRLQGGSSTKQEAEGES